MIFSHVLYQLSYLGTPGYARWKECQYITRTLTLAGVLKVEIGVAERTLTFPAHLLRRLVTPKARTRTGLVALLTAGISLLLRRTWQPQLPRMSEAWLRSHDVDFDRYDSWREY